MADNDKNEPVKRRRLQGFAASLFCPAYFLTQIHSSHTLGHVIVAESGKFAAHLGDSAEMPGYDCTHCLASNIECMHTEPVKKRGPKTGYVDQLERRANRMEELLKQFVPDLDLSQELSTTDIILPNPAVHTRRTGAVPHDIPSSSTPSTPPPLVSSLDSPLSSNEPNDEDDLAHIALSEHLKKLDLAAMDRRFFGPSSAFMMAKNVMMMKDKFTGHSAEKYTKRPKYWNMHSWEAVGANRETPFYQFPDTGLQQILIDLFFENVNPFYPLCHRPTFEQSVKSGLHRRDPRFGAVLLLVCAISSRFCDDPRVYEDGNSLGSGWKFFDQVPLMRKSLFNVPSVHDLQVYSLSALYYLGTSMPQASWVVCGIGLRFAEELGIHRRKPDNYQMTADDELKRRVFFVLLAQDRILSTFLGRSYGIHEEDYDTPPPAECDDEFWDDVYAENRFKQPPGKPSTMSFFLSYLQLLDILSTAVKNLYATKKSRFILGVTGKEWEHKIVNQLDLQLSAWLDSIPRHLRWDPKQTNRIFKKQSQILYATHYHTQVQIHRPFITKNSPLSFTSLSICTNAARNCAVVLEGFGPDAIPTPLLKAGFNAGIVLLFNLWGRTSKGLPLDSVLEFGDIRKIMTFLKCYESRWSVAGRLWDMLNELGSMKDIPVAQPRRLKRPRSIGGAPPESYPAQSTSSFGLAPPQTDEVNLGSQPVDQVDTMHWTLSDALPFFQQEVDQVPWNMDEYYCTVAPPEEMGISLPPYAPPPPGQRQQLVHMDIPQQQGQQAHYTPQPQQQMHDPGVVYNYAEQIPVNVPRTEWPDLTPYQEDNVEVWSNAPPGFSLEDWGAYISKSNPNYQQPFQTSQQPPFVGH